MPQTVEEKGEKMAEQTSFESGKEIIEQEQVSKKPGRQFIYGVAFIGGMGAATLCNMSGYPGIAFGFGMLGLIGLVMFIGSLRTDG